VLSDPARPGRVITRPSPSTLRKDPARALRNLAPLTIRVMPSQTAAMATGMTRIHGKRRATAAKNDQSHPAADEYARLGRPQHRLLSL
jgi:hypothetical protein